MQWFNDARMTTKILLCFGGLAAMLILVGGVGLSGMSTESDAVTQAYEHDLVGVELAGRLGLERALIARTYRQGILSRAPAGREGALRELDEEARAVQALLPQIRASLASRESVEKIDAIERMFAEYVQLAREAIEASATDMTRALDILDRSSPLGLRIGPPIDEIIAEKRAAATHAEADSRESYLRDRNVVVGVILVALVLGVVAGVVAGRATAVPLRNAVALLERVADGDLSGHLEVSSNDEIGQLGAALNRSLESLRGTLGGVRSISNEVSSASNQLASAAEHISGGAQAQAASLEETAASLEQISATVKQNADNAQQAAQLANGARDAAERGGQVVESAVSAMSEITRSSKKIADIITTIDEIAFQTNLLALNAAVEAARAGEQGRGFGVVAAEVRTLAQRTASAAKEIRGLIAESTSKVETGTRQVNRSGETLAEIVRSVKRVTDMVSEIAAASREQNTGVDQVNTAVTEVDKVTQGNAAQTEELSATATSLSDKAGHLEQLVAGFQLGDGPRAVHDAQAARAPRPARPTPREEGARDSGIQRTVPPPPLAAKAANGFEEF